MPRRLLPVNFPKQQLQFTEAGSTVSITLNWNGTVAAWFADLAVDGIELVSGSRVVVGVDIFDEYRPGLLYAKNASNNDVAITFDSVVNQNTRLYWYTADELAAIEAGESCPELTVAPMYPTVVAPPVYDTDHYEFTGGRLTKTANHPNPGATNWTAAERSLFTTGAVFKAFISGFWGGNGTPILWEGVDAPTTRHITSFDNSGDAGVLSSYDAAVVVVREADDTNNYTMVLGVMSTWAAFDENVRAFNPITNLPVTNDAAGNFPETLSVVAQVEFTGTFPTTGTLLPRNQTGGNWSTQTGNMVNGPAGATVDNATPEKRFFTMELNGGFTFPDMLSAFYEDDLSQYSDAFSIIGIDPSLITAYEAAQVEYNALLLEVATCKGCGVLPDAPASAITMTDDPVTLDPATVTAQASVSGPNNLIFFSGGGSSGFGGGFVTPNAIGRTSGFYFWETEYTSANSTGQDRNRTGIANGLVEFNDPTSIVVVDSVNRRIETNGATSGTRSGATFEIGDSVFHRLDLDAGTYEVSINNTDDWETIATGLTGSWHPYLYGARSAAGLIGSQQTMRITAADITLPVPAGLLTWDQISGVPAQEQADYDVAVQAYATCVGCGAKPTEPGGGATQQELDDYAAALAAWQRCIGACGTEPVDPGPLSSPSSWDTVNTVTGIQADITYSDNDQTATFNKTSGTSKAMLKMQPAADLTDLTSGQYVWGILVNEPTGQFPGLQLGVGDDDGFYSVNGLGWTAGAVGYDCTTGDIYYVDGSVQTISLGTPVAAGSTMVMLLDIDNDTLEYVLDGVSVHTFDLTLISPADYAPLIGMGGAGVGNPFVSVTVLFDQADIEASLGTAIPAGFQTFPSASVTQGDIDAYNAAYAAWLQCVSG